MTSSTLAVTDFVLARIAEDEAVARNSQRCTVCDADHDGAWYSHGELVHRLDGAEADVLHVRRNRPARVLAQCAAMRRLIDDLTAERHHVSEEDCWYTCPAATEDRDGGEVCDNSRRQGECECGRDIRVNRRLGIVASIWSDHPQFNPDWS